MVCDLSSHFTEPTIDHRPVGKKEKVRQEVGEKKTNRPVVHRGQNIIHRDLKSETRSENQGAGDFAFKDFQVGEDSRW